MIIIMIIIIIMITIVRHRGAPPAGAPGAVPFVQTDRTGASTVSLTPA